MTVTWMQPALFADLDIELTAWQQRFDRAPWVAPHDTADGMKAGQSKPGWRCPVCGDVEPNSFWLLLDHGWNPHVVDDRPWHGYCWRSVPPRNIKASPVPTR